MDVTAAAVFNTIDVTAPTGTTSQGQGTSLPVTWTTNATPSGGEFGIWIVSSGNTWTLGKVVPVNGSTYVDSVALNVPVDTGYNVYVYYRATAVDPWSIYGLAPGTVDVTASTTFSSVSVTAPTGAPSLAQGGTLPVEWTTNATPSGGEFGIWIVSSGNTWTLGKVVPVNGSTYVDSVVMNVPAGVGYQIYVYYRPSSIDPWGAYGLAPGLVTVL